MDFIMSIKLETWRELYNTAIKLADLDPWDWIEDHNLFAIKAPGYEDLGFCNIIGKSDTFHALFIHKGIEGLSNLYDLAGYEGEYYLDIILRQTGLQLTFTDRDQLENSELKLIKKLNLRFRGKNAWPVFRKFKPEILTTPIQSEREACFLLQALKLVVEISVHRNEYQSDLFEHEENVTVFRSPEFGKTQKWSKATVNFTRELEAFPNFPETPFNQIKLELLAQTLPQTDDSWIVDYMLTPVPVKESDTDEHPFFMRAFMVIDELSELILKQNVFIKTDYAAKMTTEFLNIIEDKGVIPQTIIVKNHETWAYLEPIVDRLEIELFFEPYIPVLDLIFAEMTDPENGYPDNPEHN